MRKVLNVILILCAALSLTACGLGDIETEVSGFAGSTVEQDKFAEAQAEYDNQSGFGKIASEVDYVRANFVSCIPIAGQVQSLIGKGPGSTKKGKLLAQEKKAQTEKEANNKSQALTDSLNPSSENFNPLILIAVIVIVLIILTIIFVIISKSVSGLRSPEPRYAQEPQPIVRRGGMHF